MDFDRSDRGGDVQFVSIVSRVQDRFRVDCFYEFPAPCKGFGAETETIHRGDEPTLQDARLLVTELASERGFLPAEIVWL